MNPFDLNTPIDASVKVILSLSGKFMTLDTQRGFSNRTWIAIAVVVMVSVSHFSSSIVMFTKPPEIASIRRYRSSRLVEFNP